MGLDTNFNQDPYYDDFNEDKGFHKILFKPGVAVQARELTQLQTILQTQIERFGDNILKEGTIVKGCNFNYIRKLPYVKIEDLQTDGQPVVMNNYTGLRAVGLATGVEAYVIEVRAGLESQSPNLNTLYVRYVKSSGANKTFSSTEQIQLRNFKTGAVITSVTGAGTVTGESATTIGLSTALKISDGVIYQKGNFILVSSQTTIVQKYGQTPNGLVAGFNTVETLVNSNNDTSLLDNAQGYNNENAPGADRINLTPTLVVKRIAAADADPDFFTLVEYQNGQPVRRNETTQYSVIGEEFARRTTEESGDYVLQNFPLSIKAGANSSFLEARVGRGLAYVDGKRIETFGPIDIRIDAGTETSSVEGQNVTTNIGHYVIVDEMMGSFPFNKIVNVSLYDTAQNIYAGTLNGTPTTGTAIGTAKIRGIEYLSGTVGTNTCKYKVYIFDIRMTSASHTFAANVEHIWYNGTIDAKADIVLENSKAVIKDVSFKKTFWDVGVNAIKEIDATTADFLYSTVSGTKVVATDGTTSIGLDGNNVWPYTVGSELNSTQKNDIVLICTETQSPYTVGKPIPLSGVTITVTDSQTLSFSGMTAPAAAMDVVAYYKVKKNAAPAAKVTKTVYVKIDSDTNAGLQTGTYSLGLPDVYSIEAVYKSDNNTYTDGVSANSLDVTKYFRLYPNQRDAYYDLSYVRKTKALTINANDVLLFKVKVFFVATPTGYFSVDSYGDVDDQNIPVYTSESGKKYDLRDVVDFRPYCVATAAYAESVGAATAIIPAVGAAVTFADAEQYVVAPNENMEIDYEYYLPRIDRLFLDNTGNFKIIKGVAEDEPTVPPRPAKGMSLATIKVPAFPSLTSFHANRAKKPAYATKLTLDNVVNGYTMNEIGKIDRRVKQLEYYTLLSALESESKSKAIVDENGLDRFKNGIFSDTFEDLRFAQVDSTEFSAAIDPTYGEITPQIRQFDVDLKVSAVNGVTDFGDIATLTKTDTVLIKQPYGTRGRNCVTDFYKFIGTAFIHPPYDSGYDVTRTPDYTLDIDLAEPFMDFTETLNKIVPLQQVSKAVASQNTSRRSVAGFGAAGGVTTTTRTTTRETIEKLKVSSGSETKEDIGDFVTDIRFNPFMRQKEIKIQVHGVRPETEFHFFFDAINVDAHVAPGVYGGPLIGRTSLIRRSRDYGTSVSSDSAGKIVAVFKIPAGEFFVGDRKLEIYDVATYSSRDTAISSATVTYSAFNYSVNKKGVNVSTRNADFSTSSSSSLTTSSKSSFEKRIKPPAPPVVIPAPEPAVVITAPTVSATPTPTESAEREEGDETGFVQGTESLDGDSADGDDPIAQTFFIKPEMARNDNVLYATKMDLYFETKSDTLGFTLYIPEVENGVISSNVVPGSSVHINASSVNASATGGSATTVTFPSPIPLLVGREYAFVVKPDGNNPDYRIWVSKTGESDVLTSKKITQDTNEGTLFTSTNARSWTAYQDENIKYTLHRASYTASNGYIDFTNKDSEYLSVGSVSGTFDNDEYVFVNTAVISAQTISMTAGSTTITGTSTAFTSYFSVGSHIVVKANTTVFDVLEIASISNNTTMVVTDIPKYANDASTFFKSVVGNVTLFDSNDPAILYLDNSTAANSTIKFATGNVLIGENSGAQATITSVDNKNVSYMAPNIYRTNTTQTKTLLTGRQLFRNDTNASYVKANIPFNNFTYLNGPSTVIKSRSNELTDNAGAKSFVLRTTLRNTSGATPRYSSPIVDIDIASVKISEYIVNNPFPTREHTNDGDASSKYITKTITLADGLDAEDLRVYLTAYRPPGTNIELYGKFLSNEDSDSFDSKPWTKLDSSASNPLSQNNNRFDYKEHEFSMPTAVVNGGAFLNSGAFKYTSGTFVAEDFKYFAIKIVLRSYSHHRVPRVSDIRAIALSA